jgi:alpha-glucosidase (family GH31 glycosyl hydrolase)
MSLPSPLTLIAFILVPALCAAPSPHLFQGHGIQVKVWEKGCRYAVTQGDSALPAHQVSGILLGNPDSPQTADVVRFDDARSEFAVRTPSGSEATVHLSFADHSVEFVLRARAHEAVVLRSGGASPGFGLGDHAVVNRPRFDTDITGYVNDRFLSGQGLSRLVSNFVIYPRSGFAFLVWNPNVKIVRSTQTESAQGVREASGEERFTYFLGSPREIYRAYHDALNRSSYPVMLPKYAFFGVGWEAFGALGWNTNQKTITESVDRYLSLGYPLQWMVVGSGFWPHDGDRFHETTSFGMYDPKLYPDPRGFIRHFHDKGLKYFQGLRISFITEGPFSEEGIRKGFFIKGNGKAKVFNLSWPKSPCYLLDAHNPQAVEWYLTLVKKWQDFGVDGFKEDLYGFGHYQVPDDKLDPVNQALMREHVYVMGRNQYLGSPADLHRINDFNYNQYQDRGPVNALALAYAGLPLIYPDIVGGTFGENHFDTTVTDRMKTYMMRNAMWAAVHSSMGMGQPPWSFHDDRVAGVMLGAAKLHERLHPYLYSQAVRWFHDGYPWTMTPLPIAYPSDTHVYGRENDTVRGYEWMIGDSLLAAPLYGNDYETAATRDVYLPPGTWIDYDTGKKYEGGQVLKNFSLSPEKTPLFVGGTGIVIERRDGKLLCRVYPVRTNAATEFWDKDAKTRSSIRLRIGDWKNIKVTRGSSASPVQGAWRDYAYEFELQPGTDYEVE